MCDPVTTAEVHCGPIWSLLAGNATRTREAPGTGRAGTLSKRSIAPGEKPELKPGCNRSGGKQMPTGSTTAIPMDIELTEEQQYMLRKVQVEAQSLTREELIEALCNSWEARYRQRQILMAMARDLGVRMELTEEYPWQPPETEEEFEEILGYVPTERQANEYLKELWENARMEIDMDEIVLMPDEESGD